MAENPRQLRHFTVDETSVKYGDCEADPVPALWSQDNDEMYSDNGLIERFWLPVAVAVLAGWGSISFVLVNAFGWVILLAIAGVVFAGSAAAVAIVKTGSDDSLDVPLPSTVESEETSFRNAA